MKATLYPITAAAPKCIAIVGRPRGGDWLFDELSALASAGINVLVSMLTEEEANELGLQREPEECAVSAISFVNLPIPDRSVPSDRNDFLQHVEHLAEMVQNGRFVGVHCRSSIGRSSILVVSVLMRLGWNAEDAFRAVESARGCSIPDTTEQREWVLANISWARR